MVELPADDLSAKYGRYTSGSNVIYEYHNRNDVVINGETEYDQWGTPENIAIFINLAVAYNIAFPGETLSFGDLSTPAGENPRFLEKGVCLSHASHKYGSQADIAYPTIGGKINDIKKANIERTQWILNFAADAGMNNRIIGTEVDKFKNWTKRKSDHNNHIHIGK